jgi:hypothetical protein
MLYGQSKAASNLSNFFFLKPKRKATIRSTDRGAAVKLLFVATSSFALSIDPARINE